MGVKQSRDHCHSNYVHPSPSTSYSAHRRWVKSKYGNIALKEASLESSNLIIGVDFTKSNEWTGSRSFNSRSLHHLGEKQNPYERAISIIGKRLSSFDEVPCYGLCFNPDDRPCNGFDEVLSRYRELVPCVKLAGPTSFAPIIETAIGIVDKSRGQYHVLLVIAEGQVTRSIDTESNFLIISSMEDLKYMFLLLDNKDLVGSCKYRRLPSSISTTLVIEVLIFFYVFTQPIRKVYLATSCCHGIHIFAPSNHFKNHHSIAINIRLVRYSSNISTNNLRSNISNSIQVVCNTHYIYGGSFMVTAEFQLIMATTFRPATSPKRKTNVPASASELLTTGRIPIEA
ncbi:hypothetical protein UlMin_022762 [Ulmus minor]